MATSTRTPEFYAVLRDNIFQDICAERDRQDAKWGEQNHDDLTWFAIFVEEVGEISKALIPAGVGGYVDEANVDEEITQAAAVMVAWMQSRHRNR